MKNKLAFLSTYRGETSHLVMDGPMEGKRIMVRYLRPEWYEKDYQDNVGRVFGRDYAQYQREILQSVGLVRCSGHAVSDDVVLAVNALYGHYQRLDPEQYFQGIFLPGRYEREKGWVVDLDRPAPDACLKAAV